MSINYTIFGWFNYFKIDISLIPVDGIPSSNSGILIYFNATV